MSKVDVNPLELIFKLDPKSDGLSFKAKMRRQCTSEPARRDDLKGGRSSGRCADEGLNLGPDDQAFGFEYEIGFTLAQEIDEFYSYTEVTRHLDNQKTFNEVVNAAARVLFAVRLTFIEGVEYEDHEMILRVWLRALETPDRTRRYRAAQCLLYIGQGEFGRCGSPSEHLARLISNNHRLYRIGALPHYARALETASRSHDRFTNAILVQGSTNELAKLNELNLEIGLQLSLMYLLLEVKRKLAPVGLSTELASLEPPLVPFLFGLITKLKEKSFKGYPIKKVLLLLWKALLALTGDVKDVSGIKAAQRRCHRLPPSPPHGTPKVTPEEFNLFHLGLSRKYPSCSLELGSPYLTTPATGMHWALHSERVPDENFKVLNQPLGPAELETERTSPLPLPFIATQDAVPRPILEAAELCYKHLYLSLPFVQQLQVTRDLYGLDHDPDTRLPIGVALDGCCNDPGLAKVEQLYQQLLPQAYTIVVVILKLLLATAPAPRPSPDAQGSFDFEREGHLQPPFDTPMHLSVEEVDDIRHKEIVSKAASSILLHLLTTFKLSHSLKFEFYAQMLVDSNALLLILKLYGLQDFAVLARIRNECDHLCFFKALLRPLPSKERELAKGADAASILSREGMVERCAIALPFPRGRTVFTAINFFRLLHKLTKQRLARIMVLMQFKSTIILKRGLRVPHPLLHKYIYKILRSQAPYLGRKWRQNNMKIVSAIYFQHCAGLKEGWALNDPVELNPEHQAMALRELISYYHTSRYSSIPTHSVMPHPSDSKPSLPPTSTNSHAHGRPSLPVCRSQSSPMAYTLHSNASVRPPLHHSRSVNSLSPLSSSLSSAVQAFDLDDEFISNYEDWLEQEVYNRPDDPAPCPRAGRWKALPRRPPRWHPISSGGLWVRERTPKASPQWGALLRPYPQPFSYKNPSF
ncbi:Factor arrest protein 11 [Massospora cicadina]|nr:Factor arrest protein 11 [Massospora cicadina]